LTIAQMAGARPPRQGCRILFDIHSRELPVEVLAGILGALLGGFVTLWVSRIESHRLNRTKIVQDLYHTWHSDETLRARIRAGAVLGENDKKPRPLKTYDELYADLWEMGRQEDWIAISRIMHFFEECGELLEIRAIDVDSLRKLLGRYIEFWVDGYLAPIGQASQERDPRSGWYQPIASLRIALQ
jgi:DNA-binding ferritin-like protein (Dps family)